MPDNSSATQNRSVGIDYHPVFNRGVTLGPAHKAAFRVGRETQSPKCDTLVKLDVIPNLACLPNDDTCRDQ